MTNEPCHGGIDMVNFAFFMAGHPMNFNITLFGGLPNGAPEILVGVRNTALAQTEATKPFKDSHGVTNVRGRALGALKEAQESLKLRAGNRLATV